MVAVREGHAFRGPPVFLPMVFKTKSSNNSPLVKMWIGHNEADEAVSTVSLFLRGVEMQSVLERSNYSACIYFEKHAGAIIYSALRHILERAAKRHNSHGS